MKPSLSLQNKQLKLELKKCQNFSQQLYLRHEEVRKEISRELHDEVAQLLAGINFELAILSKKASKDIFILRKQIMVTQKLIENSVEVIHTFARDLRPMILDDLGLIPAIKSYTKIFFKKTNIPVEIISHENFLSLSDLNKTVLFRVAQEALSNIAKHSKAKQVTITLKRHKNSLHMEIHDNGISFNTKILRTNLSKRRGIGIMGMEERIKIAKGTFTITSSPLRGTTIKVFINLGKEIGAL